MSQDPSPLQTALAASKPLPASNVEECIELLRGPESGTVRAKCIRRIVAIVGPGGLEAFLRQPQPALEDRTGAELLQSHPEELLRRLETLETLTA